MSLSNLTASPTHDTLLEWVHWLDINIDDDASSQATQLLARSVLAIGYEFFLHFPEQARPKIATTIEALEHYVLAPTEATYAVYFAAATQSYGFGSGDGCFAVPELTALGYGSCERGSGCPSGSGGLVGMAGQFGSEAVMQVIQRDLLAWLNGDDDPVELRILSR